eukprot:c196_g1_i1 orf=191-562(+)
MNLLQQKNAQCTERSHCSKTLYKWAMVAFRLSDEILDAERGQKGHLKALCECSMQFPEKQGLWLVSKRTGLCHLPNQSPDSRHRLRPVLRRLTCEHCTRGFFSISKFCHYLICDISPFEPSRV